ncbi:MAG: molecular chaperone SurA [Betaproteobacteria bacterium]|nr:MAG: molecular chaperone SurA [Betaproteobacteria bacterium]
MTIRMIWAAAVAAAVSIAATAAEPPRPVARKILSVDRIVAVVNEDVITRVDLTQQLNLAIDALKRQGTPPPAANVLEKQVLERMVNQKLQLQFARESGLRIDEAALDKTIARIAQQNKLSVDSLRATLAKDGVPFARFREEIRTEMIIARLREREVDSRIVVTEGEIDALLQNMQGGDARSDEYNLGHILVRVPEQATSDVIQTRQARAEEALAQLNKGADFGQIAAAFSDAPEALKGGSLGWREAGRLPTLFVDALKGMRVGQVSGLLRSANGFHILKLVDQRGAAPVFVQQTHARHILIRTNELISESEARNRLVGLRERIENGADFAELARLQSQDSSASKGGDLGWLSPGDTVPDFERTMNQLKVKQVSQPVKTEFGWHIIQVLDRREEDMSKQRLRLNARQSLRERKSDEAYQEWLRQLRDKAYVEFRTEER